MSNKECILTPVDGLILGRLERNNTLELFELIDRNRTHLSSWWHEERPLYESANDLTYDLHEKFSEFLRYGIWMGQRLIGYLSLLTPADLQHVTGYLSYWISKDECRKGYATAVVGSFTQHAFDSLSLNTLIASVKFDNRASRDVLERNEYGLVRIKDSVMEFVAKKN